MSNKLNKIYYLISYLQHAVLNDVEAEAAYFSRFRFHQNMIASTASASSFRFHIPGHHTQPSISLAESRSQISTS